MPPGQSGQRRRPQAVDGIPRIVTAVPRQHQEGGESGEPGGHTGADDDDVGGVGEGVGAPGHHRRQAPGEQAGEGGGEGSIGQGAGGTRRVGATRLEPQHRGRDGDGEPGGPRQGELHYSSRRSSSSICKREGALVDGPGVVIDRRAAGGEEEGVRHSRGAEAPRDASLGVEEVLDARQAEFGDEGPGGGLLVADGYADEADPVSELGLGLPKQGGLGAAGDAPRSPHVQNHRSVGGAKQCRQCGGVGPR